MADKTTISEASTTVQSSKSSSLSGNVTQTTTTSEISEVKTAQGKTVTLEKSIQQVVKHQEGAKPTVPGKQNVVSQDRSENLKPLSNGKTDQVVQRSKVVETCKKVVNPRIVTAQQSATEMQKMVTPQKAVSLQKDQKQQDVTTHSTMTSETVVTIIDPQKQQDSEISQVIESVRSQNIRQQDVVMHENKNLADKKERIEIVTSIDFPQDVNQHDVGRKMEDTINEPATPKYETKVTGKVQVTLEKEDEGDQHERVEQEVILESRDKHIAESVPTIRTDVLREADNRDEEEYPEEGLTKNLLYRFKNLESEAKVIKLKEHKSSGIASKSISPSVGQSYDRIELSVPTNTEEEEMISPGGIYESQPIVRTDVVKEEHRNDEEELPPMGLTKTLLSQFKQIQTSGESTPVRPRSRGTSSSGSIAEAFSLYDEASGAYSENAPLVRDDVVREGDSLNEKEELPVQGVTKNLLGMFSQVSESTNKMTEKLHKPSGVAQKQWKPKHPRVRPAMVPSAAPKAADVETSSEVAKEDDGNINEKELPKAGFARGLLQKFKSMEVTDKGSTAVYQQAWSATATKFPVKPSSSKPDSEEDNSKISVGDREAESKTNMTTTGTESGTTVTTKDNSVNTEAKTVTVETSVMSSRQVSSDDKSLATKVGISKHRETEERGTISVSQAKLPAMSRFLQMEHTETTNMEHKLSKAASKFTGLELAAYYTELEDASCLGASGNTAQLQPKVILHWRSFQLLLMRSL